MMYRFRPNRPQALRAGGRPPRHVVAVSSALKHGRPETRVLSGLLMLASLFLTGQAWAVCYYSAPRMDLGIINLNPGVVRVAQDSAIGATVGSQTVNIAPSNGVVWVGECLADGYGGYNISLSTSQGVAVAGQSKVYSTNIQGIGYRISMIGQHPSVLPAGFSVFSGTRSSFYAGWNLARFDLVKTAAVVGNGPLTPGEYGRAQVVDRPDQLYFRLVLVGGSILTPTCSVDAGSRNITVPLGSFYRNVFQGVGTTTTAQSFSFRLNCNALPPGQGNTVSITMDAAADPSGRPGVLALVADGTHATASGVGIQVRDAQGNPVVFGQAAEVGPSRGTGYTVQYTARYMQTANTVSTGQANGLATVTLTYK